MPNATRRLLLALAFSAIAAQLSACGSSRIKLNDSERAKMRAEPAIHVVHYITPSPQVRPPTAGAHFVRINLHKVPSGRQILEELNGYDPTLEVANHLVGTLSKRAGLANLKVVKEVTPLPVVKDPKALATQYKDGLILEVWLHDWSFQFIPADWKTYGMTMSAKTRLSRVKDGKVLWNTGECFAGGSGKDYKGRIVLADLNNADSKKAQEKIRQTVADLGDSCAETFMDRYSEN